MRTDADREQMFSRRAIVLGALQGGAGLLLTARMVQLSVLDQERYALQAEDNRVSLRIIPPRRGWIVDRHGKPLALNRPDYRLELVPEQIADIDATLAALADIIWLPPARLAEIRKQIASQPRYLPVEIARDLSWDKFAALNVRLPDLAGVQPVRGFTRLYPDGPRVGHLLGYVGKPTREQYVESKDALLLHPAFRLGKDGIEKTLDDRLRGSAGARRVEVNARGRILRDLSTVEDKPGANIRLTVDRDLQNYAARRLIDHSASVVVLDCQTGDLLCMASMPSFDPNAFSDGISHAEWDSLTANDHHPLINKSVQGLYPPGSTFKMMTTLAALDAGITPEQGVRCTGRYPLGGHTFHCWRRRGHGGVNMHSAIYQSCDTWFYHYGRAIGVDAIAAMARRFGLGQSYDQLPLPTQRSGIIPSQAWKQQRYDKPWLTGETLNTAIGQGYVIQTPLQLAVMTARIASGRAVEPRLIADGALVTAPPLGIPEEHLALVREAMGMVVNSGRGTAAGARLRLADVQMAGKTGTAQVRRITAAERRRGVRSNEQLPWRFRDHALFVAFAPVEAPRYALALIVEHGSSGSKTAGPIARDIITYLFEPETAMKSLLIAEADAEKRQRRLRALGAAGQPSLSPPIPPMLFPDIPSMPGYHAEDSAPRQA